MKHHCHCGFREHFTSFRIKKLGLASGIFLALHLLFHVVECLVLPAILVGLGGHLSEEPAAAIDSTSALIEESQETSFPVCWRHDFSMHVDASVDYLNLHKLRL